MSLFVLSDTHLSLSSSKPMDIFGPIWQDHEERIERNWKNVVSSGDTVVISGDVSWGIDLEEAKADLEFLDSLPGTKLISKGNHDLWWSTKAKNERFFAQNGLDSLKLLFNNAYEVGDLIVCGTRGWYSDRKNAPETSDFDKIVARENGRLKLSLEAGKKLSDGKKEKETVVFFHFPPVFGDFVCRELIETLKEYGVRKVYYGHIHGASPVVPTFEFEGISFCISSADHISFTPLLVR